MPGTFGESLGSIQARSFVWQEHQRMAVHGVDMKIEDGEPDGWKVSSCMLLRSFYQFAYTPLISHRRP